MDWLQSSYMAQKGVAKGRAGVRHVLTEAVQGRYHYVYGPSPSERTPMPLIAAMRLLLSSSLINR